MPPSPALLAEAYDFVFSSSDQNICCAVLEEAS